MISRRRAAQACLAPFAIVAAWLGVGACAAWASTGRIVDRPCLHVGIRPAAASETEWAATVQVSTCAIP